MKAYSKIITAIVFIIFIYLGMVYENRQGKENFNLFNKSDINGKITYVGIRNHGAGFSVIGKNEMFVFYPHTDEVLNDGHIFESFAAIGDQVIKEPNADTLFLKKGDKIFKYTFDKN